MPEQPVNGQTAFKLINTGIDVTNNTLSRFCIPRPKSMMKFIISPSLWRLPNFNNLAALGRRIKNNLLYFQTNYLIIALAFFALATIFIMRTLLVGLLSAAVIIGGVLFFLEHIPQAKQIKQNHPTIVIVVAIVILFTIWQAFKTILIVLGIAIAPLPVFILHASTRFTDGLNDDSSLNADYFRNTPAGQVMQMLGLKVQMSNEE